jgi:hypothetical protein
MQSGVPTDDPPVTILLSSSARSPWSPPRPERRDKPSPRIPNPRTEAGVIIRDGVDLLQAQYKQHTHEYEHDVHGPSGGAAASAFLPELPSVAACESDQNVILIFRFPSDPCAGRAETNGGASSTTFASNAWRMNRGVHAGDMHMQSSSGAGEKEATLQVPAQANGQLVTLSRSLPMMQSKECGPFVLKCGTDK